MNKEQILEKYNNPNTEYIYGFMYGKPTIHIYSINGERWENDKIIPIRIPELKLSKDQDSFFFIWGWPGPDYNEYKFKDYGITWAFTEEEIKNNE